VYALFVALLAAAVQPSGRAAPPAAARPGAERPTADVAALLRRCVDAYGGRAALARAGTTRQEGRVTSLLHPGQDGRIVRLYERPGRLRVETLYPDGAGEARVLDGGRGWRNGEEVAGPRLAAMLLQAFRVDVPALLSAWEAKVEDRGPGEVEGRKVRLLAIEPAPGLALVAEVDVETGRVLRSRGASVDPGMPLAFETTYGDFRKVEGVLVPHHERNWANGRSTGETVLEKVEFPKSLPAGSFRP
jgi:hypothetical protein